MNETLHRYLALVRERYQSFSLRERVLVSLSALAVTWFAWVATLGGYLESLQIHMQAAVAAANQRIQSATAENTRLQAAGTLDPNERLLREREHLDQALSTMDESLGTLLDRFVDPERMPSMLEDVIRHHHGLTLVRMESLPAEPMDVTPPARGGVIPEPVLIYRHPLRLEFEGGYFAVMAYLAELEAGPWKFGWRALTYEVSEYPLATVILEIETLSRERSWIGV